MQVIRGALLTMIFQRPIVMCALFQHVFLLSLQQQEGDMLLKVYAHHFHPSISQGKPCGYAWLKGEWLSYLIPRRRTTTPRPRAQSDFEFAAYTSACSSRCIIMPCASIILFCVPNASVFLRLSHCSTDIFTCGPSPI